MEKLTSGKDKYLAENKQGQRLGEVLEKEDKDSERKLFLPEQKEILLFPGQERSCAFYMDNIQ